VERGDEVKQCYLESGGGISVIKKEPRIMMLKAQQRKDRYEFPASIAPAQVLS
jgi:uncharacterized membrane protein YcaP (DUF421 family)